MKPPECWATHERDGEQADSTILHNMKLQDIQTLTAACISNLTTNFLRHTDEGEQRKATSGVKGLRQLPAEEGLSSWDSSGGEERLKGDTAEVYVPCAVDMVKVEVPRARTQELGARTATSRKSV